MSEPDQQILTCAEENRLHALTAKGKQGQLDVGETVEHFRLTQKKAKETIARKYRERKN